MIVKTIECIFLNLKISNIYKINKYTEKINYTYLLLHRDKLM